MESHIGRSLARHELVHHIDGDKGNNSIENLCVCSPQEHALYHHQLETLAEALYAQGKIGFRYPAGYFLVAE